MAFTYITITGTRKLPDGTPATGSYSFTPTSTMRNGVTTVAGTTTGNYVAGELNIELAATTDPGTTPTGVTYLVKEYALGLPTREYYLAVPHDGGDVDLDTADLVESYPAPVQTVGYSDEQVRDVIGATLVGGLNVTVTVNDPGNTVTIAATGGTPDDGTVTDAKVATGAAINADKLADGTAKKIMTAAERTKLSGIATAATANSSDATLLNRVNHTGTQSADTITDGTTNKAYTAAEMAKLAGIATAASATMAGLTDVDTTGAAVGDVLAVGGVDGSDDATGFGLSPAVRHPTRSGAPATPDRRTIISTFQAGHAWVADGAAAGSNLNDTSQFAVGTQSASRTTANDGQFVSLSIVGGPAVDMSAVALRLLFRCSDPTRLRALQVFAGSGNLASYFRWDALENFTGNTDTWVVAGDGWVVLTLPFADVTATVGTPNRAAITDIRVSVRDRSTGALTFWLQEVSLQPAPIGWPGLSFTWDDNYISMITHGRRVQSLYGFPGTAYAIVQAVGASTDYATLAQLHELEDVCGWEIAAHANTFNAHNNRFTSLTGPQLKAELAANKKWLVDNNFRGRDHIAWPGGIYDANCIAAAHGFFASARSTMNRQKETSPPAERYRLRTLALAGSLTLAAAKAAIDAAKADNAWLIFTLHKLDTVAGTNTWDIASFEALCAYIAQIGAPVRTVGDVLAAPADGPASRAADAHAAVAQAAVDVITIEPSQIATGLSGSSSQSNIARHPVVMIAQNSTVGFSRALPPHWKTYDVELHLLHTEAAAGTTAWLWRPVFCGDGDTWAQPAGGTSRTVTTGATSVKKVATIETGLTATPGKPLIANLVRSSPDTLGAVNVGLAAIVLRRRT